MNKRRTFLGYLTSTALLPFLPARTTAAARQPCAGDHHLIRVLREIVPDNPATHRLAAVALRQYKSSGLSEISPRKLFAAMSETPSPTTHQLRAHLRSLRGADFAAGNTVKLDGWILARSEVEAIVVVALHRET